MTNIIPILQHIWANHYTHLALVGALGAAVADYHAFTQFHGWADIAHFDIKTASFRWFQGAVMGVVGAYIGL